MIAKKKAELLQIAASNLVVTPPPERQLVNDETVQWFETNGIVFPRIWLATGSAQGFNQAGTDAVVELASVLRKERSEYQRATNFKNFATWVASVLISKFKANPDMQMTLSDINLIEENVEQCYTKQTIARTFLVPCSIIPERATAFAVGPASFLSVADLLDREKLVLENPEEHLTYGSLLRTMRERSACWLAEIRIEGFDLSFGTERADLAIDIALVAIQMCIPINYSRNIARITGRTMPSSIGSVFKTEFHVHGGSQRRDPGLGFPSGVFDKYRSQQHDLLKSVGNRVNAYINGKAKMPMLDQAWSDAAYWAHEGLAEPLDTIAVAKLETSIEVLFRAESMQGSANRFRDAFRSFYGLEKNQPINDGSTQTVNNLIKSIVGARSRVLHGTSSTLTPEALTTDEHEIRSTVEFLAIDLLRRITFLLDEYEILEGAKDDVPTFLLWVNKIRIEKSSAEKLHS